MPPECPAHSAVTIQKLDTDTWIIKRQVPDTGFKLVAVRVIDRLADDPAWEKTERALAAHASKNLPEPE